MTSEIIESFIDTNILVYSIDLNRVNYQFHRASLELLRPSEQEILCLSPQILGEFYAVITSSSAVTNPISPKEAIVRIERLCQMSNIKVLPISPEVKEKWLQLLKIQSVKGTKTFDIFHLATMLTYGLNRIYTFNASDFNWYSEIEVIVPEFS